MKGIKDIFTGGAGKLVEGVGSVLDNTLSSKEELLVVKKEISEVILKAYTDLISQAATVVQVEAKGNWLQRSWRPITMLMFVFIVVYSKFIALVFGWPAPELETEFWELLKIGLGGYVIGRSFEKTASHITGNMDIIPGKRNKNK
jgi:hypothetical protein